MTHHDHDSPWHLRRSTRLALALLGPAAACHHAETPGHVADTGSDTTAPPSPDPPATPTTGAPSTTTGATTTGADATSEAPVGATGSSSGGTSDAPPSCGNGVLEPGEACDLGLVELSDQGACTLTCELAVCGDGLVWAGHEACDLGTENNDTLYGGCTTTCQFGPRCNDGDLQGPEECDLGPDNNTGTSPPEGVPCDACRFHARLVFLSSETYKGGDLGGVEGAHLKCQKLAQQAGFDNSAKFKAWLSDAQHSPAQDFAHGPETADLPYALPNGVRIADDWDDLVQHGPHAGLVVTETGEVLLDERVWTGTAPSGAPFDPAAHCQAWSSSSPLAKTRVGLSGVAEQPVDVWTQWQAGRHWTSNLTLGCDYEYRIFCFEQ
jgi:hypothetical protein